LEFKRAASWGFQYYLHVKIKVISIAAAVMLLVSLMPQTAGAASAPKIKRYTVTMTKAHLPVAPNNGTDDYRCFLLDPKVTQDSIIRSIQFIPQKKNYVHHAIIFRVTDADLAEGIKADNNGAGWPCFGGTGLGGMLSTFISSPWLSSWAPGRGKDVAPAGYGETIAAKGATVKQLEVELFPAPVELACPPGVTGPLCDRRQSLIDLAARTSTTSAFEATGINALCGQDPFRPTASLTSRCDKVINRSFNVIAAAPHMHLLGRSLKLTLNPGTSDEKTILNVTNYNFDDQSSTVLKKPIAVKAGDTIRVECTFDPTLRQKIPQLKSLAPRYITWGEGSSDEMCLGVIAATKR